ncbi:hypothetical protein PR048_031823 [Dryococelus australis]|uniref:Uncharacterized protein n=1 Tax=Dryococelus australis TaxID=614101 RepID=A0ABQ9G6C9_9NEOP|nr:hypothetical protein PR048_031823 [Dryococelus australis]
MDPRSAQMAPEVLLSDPDHMVQLQYQNAIQWFRNERCDIFMVADTLRYTSIAEHTIELFTDNLFTRRGGRD